MHHVFGIEKFGNQALVHHGCNGFGHNAFIRLGSHDVTPGRFDLAQTGHGADFAAGTKRTGDALALGGPQSTPGSWSG